MGLRFRKSIKIAPGLKLNLNKKSVSLTAGTKGAHFTVNSKGKKTASAGIPGTGLSYSQSFGGKNASSSPKTVKSAGKSVAPSPVQGPQNNDDNDKEKWYHRTWFIILMLIIFFPVGLYLMWKKSNWPIVPKAIVSAFFAFFIVIGFMTSSHPESITLSISEPLEDYDINSEIPFVLSVTPEDASTSSLEYIVSDESITVTENTIATGDKEGTFEIYAKAGTVESNTITINVIDIAAREAAKAEEERLQKEAEAQAAAEAEAQRLAEEQAAKEAEEKRLAEEATAKEAEEKRLAEEKAAQEAAEKAVTPSSDGQNQTVPTQETAVAPAASANSTMVWIDDTAKRYHKKNGCGMDNAYQVTLEEAIARGKTPCKSCYK